MASELQQQVQRHREKFLVSAPIHKGRPSLFLSPKEAAAVDVADIYETAVKGLRVLSQYESRFQPYFRTLFKESSTELQRELKTASENDELDKELGEFLKLLSPYAAEHSAHTVLEYLIRRYRINELNVDALIKCVIPFHDTKIFAKVIELSTLDGSMWSILAGVQKSGSPLPRSMLTTLVRKHVSVLSALTSVATAALLTGSSANSPNPLLSAGVNRIVSFYTAVMVELCDNRPLDDAQLRVVYPFLVGGIKGHLGGSFQADMAVQWSRSSCIILAQLSRSTRLAAPFVGSITASMFEKIAAEASGPPVSEEEASTGNLIKAFVMLTQQQEVSLDKKQFDLLFTDGMSVFLTFVDALVDLAASFDLESAYASLFRGLVDLLVAAERQGPANQAAEHYQGGVNHFLCSGVLSRGLVAMCIDKIIEHALELMDTKPKKSHKLAYLGPIIQMLLQRYPEEFNAAIKALQGSQPGQEESEAVRTKLWRMLQEAAELEGSVYARGASANGTGLLLSLNHPSSEVRAAAMDTFDEVVTEETVSDAPPSADVVGLAQAVLSNLAGSDDSVCCRGWNDSIVAKLAAVLPPADVAACICTAFEHWLGVAVRKPKKDGRNVLSLILVCLRNTELVDKLSQCPVDGAEGCSFGIWLASNLLSISNLGDSVLLTGSEALKDADETRVKKMIKRFATLQTDVLGTMGAVGAVIEIFQFKTKKSESLDFSTFVAKVAEKVAELVRDRDEKADEAVGVLAAVAKETLAAFVRSNRDSAPAVESRNYTALLSLLKSTCCAIAECESDPSQVPSVRSYFLSVHELFSSMLALLVPVELSLDFNSAASQNLLELCQDYASTDFSLVLKSNEVKALFDAASMKPFASKFLHNCNPDCTLLLFFLSASTRHAGTAAVLGPLLMSGLIGKQSSSASELLHVLSEVIVADTCSSKSAFDQSSRVLCGQEPFAFRFFDPAAGDVSEPLICPDVFSKLGSDSLATSAEAKIAACQAMASVLQMMDPADSTGAAELSQAVAVVCPLVVSLLSAQQAELRLAGLQLCEQTLAMFEALKKSLKLSVSFSADISFVQTVDFDVDTVLLFCGLFLNGRELILQDPARTTQLLADNLFSSDASKLAALKNLLLSASVTFGWNYPSITSAVLRSVLMACKEDTVLESAWPFLKSLLMFSPDATDTAQSTDVVFLSELTLRCLGYTTGESKVAAKLENGVLESITEIISSSRGAIYGSVIQWLSLSGHNSGSEWSNKISESNRVVLFKALLSKSLKSPGSPDIVGALSLIPVDMSIVVEELSGYERAIKAAVKSGDFGDMGESVESVTFRNSGARSDDAASALQSFYNALDSMLPLIRTLLQSLNADSAHTFGAALCILFNILGDIVDPKFSSFVVIEYCMGIILDTIQSIMQSFLSGSVQLVAGDKSKTPSRKPRQRSSSAEGAALQCASYPSSRLSADTDCLFKVLQSSSLHHTQGSVLGVLNCMMQLSPGIVSPRAISALSDILSSTTLSGGADTSTALSVSADTTGSLLRSVLVTLTKFIEVGNMRSSVSDSSSSWDLVVQPLFAHLQTVSHLKRAVLVKTAVDVLGERCLSACTSALLSHSYVAYCNEESKAGRLGDSMELEDVDGEPKIFTAVLSRAADKKASRQVIVSPPQEMYQLALDTFLGCRHPAVQTATLVMVMNTASELFEFGLQSCRGAATDDSVCVNYVSGLLGASHAFAGVADAIKLAVLHLQFIFSVLENGTYHRLLAPHVDGWDLMDVVSDHAVDTSTTPQEYFVQLCEKSLKFLAASVNAQQLEKREKLEHGTVSVSVMSKEAWQYCANIIESLQRLLDGPTFLAVLQSLLSHEQPAVRQKALQILASRLEQLSSERDDVESSLYVGLIERIKSSVEAAVQMLSSKKSFLKEDRRAAASHTIGLAQSGALCIDLLARHVCGDKDSSWYPQLEQCLDTQLTLITHITSGTDASVGSVGAEDALYAELVRLQGSVLLSSVTVCSTLGTRILPKLSGLLQSIFQNIRAHSDSLLADSRSAGAAIDSDLSAAKKKKKHRKAEPAAATAAPTNRSRVLLLRSAVSAIASLASAMPNFMHPYVEECIVLSLSICQINFGLSGLTVEGSAEESGKMLDKDVYRSMVVMTASIPPRLCIPRLVSTCQRLNSMMRDCDASERPALLVILIRFAELISEYWGVLDRQSVATNISQLGPLMLDMMSFRHTSELQTELSRTLDDRVADSCVQLCLKLTEAEVRAFLVHATEWVAVSDRSSDSEEDESEDGESESWLDSTKAVSFYHCLAALNEKMRGVFTASMGCIWDATADRLSSIVRTLRSGRLTAPKARDEERASKKRKEVSEEDQEEGLKTIHELILLSTDILNSIRSCCLYDKVGFIDEERYDLVISNAVALLGSRKWFSSEEDYEAFCLETVAPCFTALAIAVGKDTLWKPMNHAILMLTREKKKIVRVVCVKALHKLFSEVGEEYLILLPESLPFLSELLEDSNPAVSAATAALVRYIEDVSGESMDTYLQ